MAILHTVNKTPYEKGSLRSCLVHALDGSAVILIEDGVYAAVRGGGSERLLSDAAQRLAIFALEPDLRARGLQPRRLVAGIEVVGYRGFVRLCAEYDKVLSWL